MPAAARPDARTGEGVASPDDDALRLAWCSDCRQATLFETVLDALGEHRGSDWACTGCGAAYLDGIDITLSPVQVSSAAATRGPLTT